MARKKKRLRNWLLPIVVATLFVAIANLCDTGVLPSFLQKPIDSLNSATHGMLYQQTDEKSELSVHYIDVGQGDSILISCGGENMLIDAGVPEKSKTVEDYLYSHGVRKLDFVVGTHPHDDHIGGMSDVIADYEIGRVILPDATTTTRSYERLLETISKKKLRITQAKVNDTYTLGTARFVILAPVGTYDDLNNMSVVIRLDFQSHSFLFTGDASSASEKDMLARGENLRADVLKVGHHGSSTATTQQFLDAVRPKYAVISVGKGNSYGLPDKEVTQRLITNGVKVYRTDTQGTITIVCKGNNLTIKEES